jgi:undecaprenyl-diphosphatase
VKRILEWLGSHELALLLAAVGIAAGVWAFFALASEIQEGDTQAFDRKVLLSMRHADLTPKGSPAFQEAARDVTALGGMLVLGMVTLATAVFLTLESKGKMGSFVLCSVAGGAGLSILLKDVFNRPRPDIAPHLAYASSSSFPSGHAMMSALTWLTLGALLARSHSQKRLKAFFLITATLLTLMIGTSRVYLGVHWPTDVLAGWTAGSVWALLSWLVARRLQQQKTLEQEGDSEADARAHLESPGTA